MLNILIVSIMIGGWGFGRLFRYVKLPSAVGMLVWGILFGIIIRKGWFGEILNGYGLVLLKQIEPFLKSLALVVILLRGGLGISREALNRHGWTAFFLSWLPALFEMGGLTLLLHFGMGFSWQVALLTAAILSAVSLAVVVPAMLELKQSGIGKKKDIPTLVLAASSLDNVVAVTMFSLVLQFISGNNQDITRALWVFPWSIGMGIILGGIVGWGLSLFFEKNYTKIRATEKAIIILMFSLMAIQVGDILHVSSLVTIVMIGFILLERSPKVAHEIARKMNVLWVAAEIILFVLVGMAVDINKVFSLGLAGIGIIFGGLAFRSLGVVIATARTHASWKEKLFCIIAYLPKATVQAALGSVPLAYGIVGGETILALAVAAIVITAPLGAYLVERFSVPLLHVDLGEKGGR
ncbi:cation:proton antiporter domain-containing protein [Thermospira aquatica]|uniref:Cation:proton antiporter n=1 Tax=Thermospira aquatica TaxID=2828656 RepID=A0AAX3BF79_9SPIR|nr:cation:proton antiporter [Thermospira aquatica]URA10994.1 cation:proton antiporter [Thermospira aquatica]